MNKFHLLTVISFLVAFALYAVSAAIAIGFGVLGFVFELMAWGAGIKAKKETKKAN